MRLLLILWLAPVSCLFVWYGLSSNDLHMGTMIFSRELHDKVFSIYGNILGIDPALLPAMVAKAIAFDSLIVLGIIAYRLRRKWYPGVKQWVANKRISTGSAVPVLPQAEPSHSAK